MQQLKLDVQDAGPAAQPVPLEPPESQAVGDDARKGDKASRREEAAAKRRQAAELELLLLDEGKLRHTAAQGELLHTDCTTACMHACTQQKRSCCVEN